MGLPCLSMASAIPRSMAHLTTAISEKPSMYFQIFTSACSSFLHGETLFVFLPSLSLFPPLSIGMNNLLILLEVRHFKLTVHIHKKNCCAIGKWIYHYDLLARFYYYFYFISFSANPAKKICPTFGSTYTWYYILIVLYHQMKILIDFLCKY